MNVSERRYWVVGNFGLVATWRRSKQSLALELDPTIRSKWIFFRATTTTSYQGS